MVNNHQPPYPDLKPLPCTVDTTVASVGSLWARLRVYGYSTLKPMSAFTPVPLPWP